MMKMTASTTTTTETAAATLVEAIKVLTCEN